jgi:hypothetical protein
MKRGIAMMKLWLLGFLLAFTVSPCRSQNTTGNAKTTGACSPAISGNNNQVSINCQGISKEQAEKMTSILNKILANQIDPAIVIAKLDEILKSINPNARTTTYNCSGNQTRSTGPGRNAGLEVNLTVGDDSVLQEMIRLYNSRLYSDLLKLSVSQIQSRPEWLTSRLFAGVAYLNLGDGVKAKEMLKEFDSKTGPAYDAEPCQQIAIFLHSHLQ